MKLKQVSIVNNTKLEEQLIQNKSASNFGLHYGLISNDKSIKLKFNDKGDSGHFGTGYYCVSLNYNIDDFISKQYTENKNKKLYLIDFSKYNLYTPKDYDDASDLFSKLKAFDDLDKDVLVNADIYLSKNYKGDVNKYKDDFETVSECLIDIFEVVGKHRSIKNIIRNNCGAFISRVVSPSTIIMKILGFDGVDVRHIKDMDNFSRGSVIYNIKDGTVQNIPKKDKQRIIEKLDKYEIEYNKPISDLGNEGKLFVYSKLPKSIEESMNEDIEKHETLNPLLWNEDNTLKPEVKDKLMKIADEFIKGLEEDGIKMDVDDIKIVGSNCSYNYTKDSDIDLHIIAKNIKAPKEIYALLYSAYRSLWNKNYDIDFYGIPVEIYVETPELDTVEATTIDVEE